MDITKAIAILTVIVAILTAIFIGYQALFFKKDYNLKNDKAEIEKAIEIAKLYEELLRNKMAYLQTVFKKIGIQNLLIDIKYDQLVEFDVKELNEILSKDNIKKLDEKRKNIDLRILIQSSILLKEISIEEYLNTLEAINNIEPSLNHKGKQQIAPTLSDEVNKDQQKKKQRDKDTYEYYARKYNTQYLNTIGEIFNSLEFYCMSFNTCIANEKVVYQSLHQTFLSTIKMLYIYIAELNESGKDKLFINIIQLYNKWSDRYIDQQREDLKYIRGGAYKNESIKR